MAIPQPQLVSVGHIAPDPTWGMTAHSHSFHEIICVTAGRMTAQMNGQGYTAETGQCLWYPAGVLHEEGSDPGNPVETYYIAFHWDDGDRDWPLCFRDAKGRLSTLIRWLLAERDTGAPVQDAFICAILAEFIRLQTTTAAPSLPERIRTHMRTHLAESLTLDDLADCAGMSKFYFARRYRSLTGLTPMADLRQLRLERVRDLLLTTDLPLKAIAPRTGLGNEYHLSRLFRRAFGISPGELRRHR